MTSSTVADKPSAVFKASPARQPKLGLILALLMSIAILAYEISTGTDWNNFDNAVRAWQVADVFHDGQWRDLTWSFVTMPEPLVSHTSRTHDVPFWLAAKAFSLFMTDDDALRASFATVPLTMLVLYLVIALRLLRRFYGSDDLPLNACVFVAVACLGIMHFGPGDVDNHNTQQILFLACLWQAVRGLDEKRFAGAWLAGLTLLSLTVSLETLPHLLGIYVFLGLHALLSGPSSRTCRVILEASATLALLSAPASLLVLGRETFLLAETDIFSAAYATVLTGAGAGVWLGMRAWVWTDTFGGNRKEVTRITIRFATVLFPAGLGVALALIVHPQILAGPYEGMSDIARQEWLNTLLLHKSMFEALSDGFAPLTVVAFAVELAVVLVAVASWRRMEMPLQLLTVVALVSLCVTTVEIRNEAFLAISAGLLGPIMLQHLRAGRLMPPIIGVGCATIFMSTPFLGDSGSYDVRSEWAYTPARQCGGYGKRDLAGLAPGSIVAPVKLSYGLLMLGALDAGPHTLAHIGAHRSHPGKTRALTGWMADTDAERHEAMAHFDYVAVCRETQQDLASPTRFRNAPLFEQIHSGDVPHWLERVSPEESPLMVFRIARTAE